MTVTSTYIETVGYIEQNGHECYHEHECNQNQPQIQTNQKKTEQRITLVLYSFPNLYFELIGSV